MSKALDRVFAALPEKLSIDQLTDVLNLSSRTVTYKWLREGNVPAMKLGGSWLILRDDVKEHLERSYNVQPGSVSSRPSADEEQASGPGDIVSEYLILTPEHADEESRTLSEPASHPAGETRLIRQWARDNGYDVNPRGRISLAIVDAYNDAQRRAT